MVFLESPIGVGFSYDTTNVSYITPNDDQTSDQNFNAIVDFFTEFVFQNSLVYRRLFSSHPEYNNRDFYLAGESYAGMYISCNMVYRLVTNKHHFRDLPSDTCC